MLLPFLDPFNSIRTAVSFMIGGRVKSENTRRGSSSSFGGQARGHRYLRGIERTEEGGERVGFLPVFVTSAVRTTGGTSGSCNKQQVTKRPK